MARTAHEPTRIIPRDIHAPISADMQRQLRLRRPNGERLTDGKAA